MFHALREVLDFDNFRDVAPERVYPREADGSVAKFNDIPKRYRDNVDTSDPPFERAPGDAPAMTAQDEGDIIAFMGALPDGYPPVADGAAGRAGVEPGGVENPGLTTTGGLGRR